MKRKISVFFLLCVATVLHGVAAAQGLSIFAKQKVVIWDIFDRNDQPLDEGFKRLIYQKLMDDCTNSQRYAVYNECVEDAKRQLKAKGLAPEFQNICEMIGQKADFIIFTELEASQSSIGSQDVTIHISMSLYRIKTASKVLPVHEDATASVQSVMSAISRAMAKLGMSSTAQRQSPQQPSYQQPAHTQPAQTASQQSVQSQSSQNSYNSTPTTTANTCESAEELYDKSYGLYLLKRYAEAVPLINEAVKRNPTNADFWTTRGQIFYYLKNLDECIASYVKVVELQPNMFTNCSTLGFLYVFKSDDLKEKMNNRSYNTQTAYEEDLKKVNEVYKQALRWLEKAHQLQPNHFDVVNMLKVLSFYLRDEAGMIEKYNKYKALSNQLK